MNDSEEPDDSDAAVSKVAAKDPRLHLNAISEILGIELERLEESLRNKSLRNQSDSFANASALNTTETPAVSAPAIVLIQSLSNSEAESGNHLYAMDHQTGHRERRENETIERSLLESRHRSASAWSTLLPTATSLAIVIVLLAVIRWLLPPLLESSRYSWFRGQLRAQHEAAGVELRQVSLDGLSRISELVSQRTLPSVAHINIRRNTNRELLADLIAESDTTLTEHMRNGQGSAVIVDSAGFLITNFHVLEDGEEIEVRLSDDSRAIATMVGYDEIRDIAVLKIPPTELPPITWGNSDAIKVGSPVWAVGSPFGLTGSITFGILSSKHRVDLSESRAFLSQQLSSDSSDLMQSDVAINPGNSGGPLMNGRGEMVGINTAILGPTYQGVSFSIPSKLVKEVYEQIVADSKSTSVWMGVMLRAEIGGSEVTGFTKIGRSAGRDAGLEIGDVILGIDGRVCGSVEQSIAIIQTKKPGTVIDLDVMRQKQAMRISVQLASKPVTYPKRDSSK